MIMIYGIPTHTGHWRRLPAVDEKSLGLPAILRDQRAATRAPYWDALADELGECSP